MPTVTAIALETLLEPGSSSSGSQHNRGGHGIGILLHHDPTPRGGSSAASSSLKEHHRHQPGVRREQQPIFLSRRPRDESEVSVAADRNDAPRRLLDLGQRGAFPPIHLEGSDSATKAPNSTMEVTVRELTNGTHGGSGDENNSSDLRSHSGGLSEKECPDASIDDDMDDNFFDPRELMSTVSSSDTEDGGSVLRSGSGRCHTPLPVSASKGHLGAARADI
ncbi:unnamed protein product [Spirodela intermedia]|uniref:Uncharacterized protein n=1 Tax=Spirodela intermedia TaxID=51605 RepID=A0A7I8JFD5_SPIIN|nr:unnamed protein product [Spirodela intermedia]CAA6668839.1 unnamed protein product [Spirodela intermedia]